MNRISNEKAVSFSGKKVKLAGWVSSIRSHGKIVFLDIRDETGIIQAVVNPEKLKMISDIKNETVVEVVGEIKKRPEKMVNPEIKTGSVEIGVSKLKILSDTETIPFELDETQKKINEEVRMKYRYIDLRRERMQRNLRKRHESTQFLRNFLSENGFIGIETPILTKSTPEGARDFLVPSRKIPGSFYALPQSPQQYKQLLMVGGFEKYFQFARCFRDEDVRADRQAEFTQLDIEMSFVDRDDVLKLVEEMYIELVENVFPNKSIKEKPFPKISYDEAISRWNSDRPDLRKDKDNPDELAFAFIVDFPMFEKFDGGFRAEHHPFTKPKATPKEIRKNPEKIKSFQYDLVLNGAEIGGGSIRAHKPDMLKAIFEVLGHKEEEIENKFGHLLEAFNYGVPPHGGMAFGFDRLLMVLLEEESIRDVIAFPKTGDGRGLMMNTPSADISPDQLKELSIKIDHESEN